MIPEFLKQIGLSSAHPIFHCDKKKELYWLVNDMLVHSKSNFSSDLRRTGLLYEFLSILEGFVLSIYEIINKDNYGQYKDILQYHKYGFRPSNYFLYIQLPD